MTWPEIKQAAEAGALVVLPIAAIEQHGPHLPVDTDSNTAWEIAVRAARQIQEFPILVIPTLWAGYSPHHMGFPGTLSLRAETLIHVTMDLVESILKHGFRKIVILNGHGGNEPVLNTAVSEIAARLDVRVPVVTWWGPFAPEITGLLISEVGGTCHSGEIETAIQLHLQPELVHMERAVKELAKSRGSFIHFDYRDNGPSGVFYPSNTARDTQYGVYGDPMVATGELGARILEAVVSQFVRFLTEFWSFPEST
jgi:creatinine amidohydrolase